LGDPFFADGVTYPADNISILFLGGLQFTPAPPNYHGLEEIQAHELGHQFPGVDALPWTDTHTYLPNYTGSGNDIMTYNATEFDSKFFDDTIKAIRMALLEVV
jgi:hypothetical protein